MAHLAYIEDENGDVEDYEVYCSDSCALTHRDHYNGWNGCNEISISHPCECCGAHVQGLDEE